MLRRLVQRQAPDLVQRPTVAEEHVQLPDLLAKRPVGRRGEPAPKRVPALGLPRLAPAGQGGDQSGDDLERYGRRPAGRRREQGIDRSRPIVDVLAQPAGDQADDGGHPGVGRQRGERVGLGLGDGDQARSRSRTAGCGRRRPRRARAAPGPEATRRRTGSRWSVEASTSRTRPERSSRAMATSFDRRSAGGSTSGPIRRLKMVSIGRSSVSSRTAQARTDSCSWSSKPRRNGSVGPADDVQRPERPAACCTGSGSWSKSPRRAFAGSSSGTPRAARSASSRRAWRTNHSLGCRWRATRSLSLQLRDVADRASGRASRA